MNFELDDWQKGFIATEGDKILCSGRQVGKSEICGIDAGERAVKTGNKNYLIIAPTERQAYALYEKVVLYVNEKYPKMICKGINRPTKTKLTLINGTKVYCLPVGLTGLGIRFMSIHRLYADECSRIPDEVWSAVTPMLIACQGVQIHLSTLHGRTNRFYKIWANENNAYGRFKRFSITTEKCFKERKISKTWTIEQRDFALQYLEDERKRMSKREFAQEYEAIAMDGLEQFFPTDLLRKIMDLTMHDVTKREGTKSLGGDIAREGGDETAAIGLLMDERKSLWQIQQWKEINTSLTYAARRIYDFWKQYAYNKLYIDDGGLGSGVIDILLETDARRSVKAINNGTWAYSNDRDKHKKLMKEHLYNNLLVLMEQGKIHLWKNDDLFNSLTSIQCEYVNEKFRIFGKYSHLTEALVRAAWVYKEKGLNIWIA